MIVPADFFEAIEVEVRVDENLLIESTFKFPDKDTQNETIVLTLPAEMAEQYMMMLMSSLAKRKRIKQAPVD